MARTSAARWVLLLIAARFAAGLSLRREVLNELSDASGAAAVHELSALTADWGTASSGSDFSSGVPGNSRDATNSSDLPGRLTLPSGAANSPETGMKLKGDLTMAAALLSTPLVLVLLRTDMLRQPNLTVVLVVSALYILASLAMNVLNKKAAKAFEGTCLLVIIQMLVAVVVIICMEYGKMKMDKWVDFVKWLIVPFAFAGMLGTSMFAFKEASLTTILIMRNILPILTFGFEKALFNQPQSLRWSVVMSLVVTLVGSMLYGFVDISATNLGKMLILVNCLFTIVDRIVQAHLLKGNEDFSISISMCMLLNNSLGVIPMLALAMATGEIAHWGHSVASADRNTWFLVVMSGLCGASLGYVGLRAQQLVSGTTVLVMQNFNKVLIISIGMGVFHEHLTPLSLMGCAVSLLGCFAYGYLRLPAEAKSKGASRKSPWTLPGRSPDAANAVKA